MTDHYLPSFESSRKFSEKVGKQIEICQRSKSYSVFDNTLPDYFAEETFKIPTSVPEKSM